jgi:TonB family protein
MPLAPLSLNDPEKRRSLRPVVLAPSDYPLHLELTQGGWGSHGGGPYWWKVIAGSLCIHLLLLSLATKLPSFVAVREPQRRVAEHRVPLYFPKDALTQKAPNQREVSKQVDIDSLLALQHSEARQASPDHSIKQFEMPKNFQTKPLAKAPVSILPDAPAVTTAQTNAPPLPGAINGLAIAPPPPAPAPAAGPFQNIGAEAPPNPHPTLAPPKATVQAAIDGMHQSGTGSHVVISDDSPTQGARPMPGIPGQRGAQHAGVELKSDPQGIDMRPYLAQILTIVRANWRRVIPQSVRMGTMRGRTVVEFIINRDGSIPKLVTAESSGLDPLDRAAVAGLSMSNPLPPLPPDFKGEQVRLAFTFAYNSATQ